MSESDNPAPAPRPPWAGIASLVCLTTVAVIWYAGITFLSRYRSQGEFDIVPAFILIPMYVLGAGFILAGTWLAIFQIVRTGGWLGVLSLGISLGIEVSLLGGRLLGGQIGSSACILRVCAIYGILFVLALLLLVWARGPRRKLMLGLGFGGLLVLAAVFPLYCRWVAEDPIARFEYGPDRWLDIKNGTLGKTYAFEGWIDAQPIAVNPKKARKMPPGYFYRAAPGYGRFELCSAGFQGGFETAIYYRLDAAAMQPIIANYLENRRQKYWVVGKTVAGRSVDRGITADVSILLAERIEPFDPSKRSKESALRHWVLGAP